MEEKKKKKKPTWKFWALSVSVILLIGLLVFTLCYYGITEWLHTMLLPLTLGAFASVVVSIYFTVKTESDKLQIELAREINIVIEKTMKLQEELYTISYFPFYSGNLKKVMLNRTLVTIPDMYAIKGHYRELWDLYRKNTQYISRVISGFSEKDYTKEFNENSSAFGLALIEINDKALKVQQQFLQDFKLIPKAPIKNQLTVKMNSHESQEEEVGIVDFLIRNSEEKSE